MRETVFLLGRDGHEYRRNRVDLTSDQLVRQDGSLSHITHQGTVKYFEFWAAVLCHVQVRETNSKYTGMQQRVQFATGADRSFSQKQLTDCAGKANRLRYQIIEYCEDDQYMDMHD